MSKIKIHPPVKLIIGLIFQDPKALVKAERILVKKFGKVDFESLILSFTHTDYYENEFGKNLKRKFISFKDLINPQNLATIKIYTDKIEKKLSIKDKRQVNLDPGYLNFSKLVLATAKDYSHRVYLKNGIYAEVTLYYQDKMFKGWPWTYPDFKIPEYNEIFKQMRSIYALQIKK